MTIEKRQIIKLTLLFSLGILLVLLIDFSSVWDASLMYVEQLGWWGYLLFILIYNLATVFFIPGSVLTIKGGCLFGLFLGSIIVMISATLGAIVSFLLGRYYCRDWISEQIDKYPLLKKIDLAVAEEGWKIVFVTRLCPLFPFNILNYFFGITEITLRDYILGSFAIIPGTIMYVYIGSLARDLATFDPNNYQQNPQAQLLMWGMHFVGFIATIAITIYSVQIARKVIKKNILDGD